MKPKSGSIILLIAVIAFYIFFIGLAADAGKKVQSAKNSFAEIDLGVTIIK